MDFDLDYESEVRLCQHYVRNRHSSLTGMKLLRISLSMVIHHAEQQAFYIISLNLFNRPIARSL